MTHTTRSLTYRLALDLGSTSLGWAVFLLNAQHEPTAIARAGVRIFGDGRNPKDGSSLAVTRRLARGMRRRRDRLLKRKLRMREKLTQYGFFPADVEARKALEPLNPYALRARGLTEALSPAEFARALFHINQRRGFKSNRKTDKKDNDSGALKAAISSLRSALKENDCPTVGAWLWQRMQNGELVRARYRETRFVTAEGRNRIDKSYDLYIDRAMIEEEFDRLWAKQAEFNPTLFNETARIDLKDTLLYQRQLKTVSPGRCTLLPEKERAPKALPSQQRFRIYQETNNLRLLDEKLHEIPLTLAQRDKVVAELEKKVRVSFTSIRKLLGLNGSVQFNLEDDKRLELKGNTTSATLSKPEYFGASWEKFSAAEQDEIVLRLMNEEDEEKLIDWLQQKTGIDETRAEEIANVALAEGYGSLSCEALDRILPEMARAVITYDKAVIAAGFAHHSQLGFSYAPEDVAGYVNTETGEVVTADGDTCLDSETWQAIFGQLPYYGKVLQRHVGFGSREPEDGDEKRYGKIANPTVHIGLNQVRVVVNALVRRYGRPAEIVIEVARELKQSRKQKLETQKQQAGNQKRNERIREEIAAILRISKENVSRQDIQKWILWEELNKANVADRRCPYSGEQISATLLLSERVEIEHILPFSQTLDDSLNNKTVSMRRANRIKGNRTPWEAKADFEAHGWSYEGILQRAAQMPRGKRWRFGAEAMQDKDFLARALNDTRHLSLRAAEYLKWLCPGTRVIPGTMTALLRGKFGLNHVLGLNGEKNRNDHRHHAVDACVIGVTDQGLLQKFAEASVSAEKKQLERLVEDMPAPWPTYYRHVQRAVADIKVSHKPDHRFEGAMMEETSYGLRKDGSVRQKREGREVSNLIRIAEPSQPARHGVDADGKPIPYKGYVSGSNYCIEITENDKGRWEGEVISTFRAYEIAREEGSARLRHPRLAQNGKPLVMRLMIDDCVRLEVDGREQTMRVVKIFATGPVTLAAIHEANVDARNRDKEDSFSYVYKSGDAFRQAKARRVTLSPIGDLRDPGFPPKKSPS
jgi:CRISPR-associated endonuclease Csn1